MSFNNVLDVLERLDKAEFPEALTILTNDVDCDDYEILAEFIQLIGNRNEVKTDRQGNVLPNQEKRSDKLLDLKQDADYIYSSFRQIGINLYDEFYKMSWWEFQAILNGLPENTQIKKIIEIRAWKPSKGDSVDKKRQMKELQKYYRLKKR